MSNKKGDKMTSSILRGKGNALWNKTMPRLMEKYNFDMKTPIIKCLDGSIITDPQDLRDFKNAWKYPNGFPNWKNN